MDNPDETIKYLAEMVDLLKENQKKIEVGQIKQTTILAEIKEEQKSQFNNLKEWLSKESRKQMEIYLNLQLFQMIKKEYENTHNSQWVVVGVITPVCGIAISVKPPNFYIKFCITGLLLYAIILT